MTKRTVMLICLFVIAACSSSPTVSESDEVKVSLWIKNTDSNGERIYGDLKGADLEKYGLINMPASSVRKAIIPAGEDEVTQNIVIRTESGTEAEIDCLVSRDKVTTILWDGESLSCEYKEE